MAFVPHFKAARTARSITQADAAERIGIATSTLSKWENGETEPLASQLDAMADVYGVSVDQLMGRRPLVAEL